MKHLFIAAITLTLLMPLSSIAQDSNQQSKEEYWKKIHAIEGLKSWQRVRIHVKDEHELTAQFHWSDADSIYLDEYMERSSVAISEINALWVRGQSSKSGLLIGAIGLGVSGMVSGYSRSRGLNYDGTYVLAQVALGGIWGGLIGGAVGAGIGAVIPKWHDLYHSKDYNPAWKKLYRKGKLLSVIPSIHKGGIHVSASISF